MTGRLSEEQLARILHAIETIEDCLRRLVETRDAVDRAAYRTDRDTQAIVERRFVKMTEATLDIGTVLLIYERGEPPESNPATMLALAESGILSDGVAGEMADAARFRNVLAHTYGDSIDHDVVYDALADLERYRNFALAIRNYLDDEGALDISE